MPSSVKRESRSHGPVGSFSGPARIPQATSGTMPMSSHHPTHASNPSPSDSISADRNGPRTWWITSTATVKRCGTFRFPSSTASDRHRSKRRRQSPTSRASQRTSAPAGSNTSTPTSPWHSLDFPLAHKSDCSPRVASNTTESPSQLSRCSIAPHLRDHHRFRTRQLPQGNPQPDSIRLAPACTALSHGWPAR